MRIIRARCGDALTDDDLALIAQPAAPPAEMLPELRPPQSCGRR
jgi:hypothetical protein